MTPRTAARAARFWHRHRLVDALLGLRASVRCANVSAAFAMSAALSSGAAFSTGAIAAGPAQSAVSTCRPDGTPAQVNACAVQSHERAQVLLQRQWEQRLRSTPPPQRAVLEKAQQAWLRQRDTECRTQAQDAGSDMAQSADYHACLKQRTLARVDELSRP